MRSKRPYPSIRARPSALQLELFEGGSGVVPPSLSTNDIVVLAGWLLRHSAGRDFTANQKAVLFRVSQSDPLDVRRDDRMAVEAIAEAQSKQK